MQTPAATIVCPNYTCEQPNPEHHQFCEKCRTPLPKRYLWVVGTRVQKFKEKFKDFNSGEVLADRYVLKGDRLLLDTKPGKVPDVPVEIPDLILPYLRLFSHRIHVPQVYGQLVDEKISKDDLWLLEQGPIYSANPTPSGSEPMETPAPQTGKLMPALIGQWAKASPLRQLNWLWQIANLWHPFMGEGVAGSLLNPELIRVEGSIVRLLELRLDSKFPNLENLGQFWSEWISTANPLIAPFLEQLCQLLSDGEIKTSDQLVALLDRALNVCGQLQKREYAIATDTNQGPSRRRNEDACYPNESSTLITSASGLSSLAIVCDGIGGHEGGNVASNMAIDAVKKHIEQQQKSLTNLSDPRTITTTLENAAGAANEAISAKNDSQQKQGRQRMGTTLVMSYTHAHELYITHVGDSRAYWINRSGCRQVTIDDDVASRHVCFGYILYRDALQQPSSGSLVQALGMGPSAHLHPSVGRFIIDEDSLFLLCSDGLSDNDRVEQYWQSKILPVLNGELSLTQGVNHLIDLANYHNGHDNVTVALVHCRVSPNPTAQITPEALLAELEQIPLPLMHPDAHPDEDTELPKQEVSTSAPTKLATRSTGSRPLLPILLAMILVVGLGIVALNLNLLKKIAGSKNSESSSENKAATNLETTSTTNSNPLPPQKWEELNPGTLYQIKANSDQPESAQSFSLYEQSIDTSKNIAQIKTDTFILVKEKPENRNENAEKWVKVQVCSTSEATDSATTKPPLGWLSFSELEQAQINLEKSAQEYNDGPCFVENAPPAESSKTEVEPTTSKGKQTNNQNNSKGANQ
jgi:serine/threonine protein phosphatase PrpC